MLIVEAIFGIMLILVVLWDAFETIVLPRRVARRLGITRIFYLLTWRVWSGLGRRFRTNTNSSRRETYLSFYGPLSLLFLLVLWALVLVLGFGLLQFAVSPDLTAPDKSPGFGTYLYMSGTTFFTLGFGDVTPTMALGRVVAVAEGGTGFGFLGLVIGYLPVIYQSFSRREVNISLLDARAGSPPSAATLLARHCQYDPSQTLRQFLNEWERWSADILESHLSYQVLSYFRSQHENQSWVASLTTILDICALIMVGIDDISPASARLTFAMARHTAVDLSQVFGINPNHYNLDQRLNQAGLVQLRAVLLAAGVKVSQGEDADAYFSQLRQQYEPYMLGLSNYLMMPCPDWFSSSSSEDNWQRTAWHENQMPLF